MPIQDRDPPTETIKVLRPRLPTAAKLLPYLERIDDSRIYSNYGPLNAEFARRLGDLVGGSPTTLTSNGTTAIELALRLRCDQRGHCLMPAFTFIASAHAVCNAGLTPYLLETDPNSLALTPEIAAAALNSVPGPVAAVLVVSAFGAPPDFAAWTAFEKEHGIPVVFEQQRVDLILPETLNIDPDIRQKARRAVGSEGIVKVEDQGNNVGHTGDLLVLNVARQTLCR